MSEIERAANPTTEEAIKYLERMLFTQDFHPSTLRAKAVNTMAIAALREQAERSKGCEWCKVGQDNARTVWIDGSFDAFTGDSYGEGASHKGIIDRKAAYCPMCGKRLEVEP